MLSERRVFQSSRSVARALLIGSLYFVASAVAIRFTRFDGGAACLWFATAILLAEFALRQPRDWALPAGTALFGGIVATGLFGVGFVGAPIVTVCIVGEAMIAAWLLQRWNTAGVDLGSLRGVMLFVAVSGIVAPAVSGVGGAAVIALATDTDFTANWQNWYFGHALGTISIAPIVLLVLSGDMVAGIARLRFARKLEGLGLMALTFGVAHFVFAQSLLPLLFLPLLPLMIAAFRFDWLGGAIAIVILALVGGTYTIGYPGMGPVQSAAVHDRALFLQFYLACSVVMTLLVSAELAQRKRLMVALRASEARYRLIADGSSDVIFTLSVAGRIEYISPSVTMMGGYDPIALLGMDPQMLVLAEDRPSVRQMHRQALADPSSTFIIEYRGIQANGAILWCESHLRAIVDEDGQVVGAVSFVRDISRHKRVQAELARAAQTDPLTGIVNRRAFEAALDERLAEVTAGRGSGVCAVLDLDFFKRVNDRYGHAAGDTVLCAFADVARRSLRSEDLIARLGGEEFGVIVWNADLSEAQAICERLRREIADLSVAIGMGDAVRITFSGGLAPLRPGRSRAHVLHQADTALYRAKNAGRNRLELGD